MASIGSSAIPMALPAAADAPRPLRDYDALGFTVEPLFDAADIAALRADVTEHIDRVAHALHLPFAASAPEAGFAERLEVIARADPSHANLLRVALCTDAHRGPRFGRLVDEGRIQQRASDIAGVAVGDPVVRLRASVPALGGDRQGWHSDVSRPGQDGCSAIRIACWLPLMDAGPDTGGLEIVTGRRDAPIEHDARGFEIADAAIAGLPRVAPECPMGRAIFLDRYTPHRAMPHQGEAARIALVVWLKTLA